MQCYIEQFMVRALEASENCIMINDANLCLEVLFELHYGFAMVAHQKIKVMVHNRWMMMLLGFFMQEVRRNINFNLVSLVLQSFVFLLVNYILDIGI